MLHLNFPQHLTGKSYPQGGALAALRISTYIPRAILRARSPPRATLRISNLHPEGDPQGPQDFPLQPEGDPKGPILYPEGTPKGLRISILHPEGDPKGAPPGRQGGLKGESGT